MRAYYSECMYIYSKSDKQTVAAAAVVVAEGDDLLPRKLINGS